MRPSFKFCSLRIFPLVKLSWHSCYMWDKPGWLNWFWQFHCGRLFSFNPKRFYYSYAWSHSLYEGRTCFCTGLTSRKLFRSLLMFLTGFTSLTVLLLFSSMITFLYFIHSFWFYFIPSNSQQDAPSHYIAHDYSHADWGSLCDHLRDAPLNSVLLLQLVNFVSSFGLELMYVSLIISIYQVLISMVFSCFAATAVHRNHFLFVPTV